MTSGSLSVGFASDYPDNGAPVRTASESTGGLWSRMPFPVRAPVGHGDPWHLGAVRPDSLGNYNNSNNLWRDVIVINIW